MTSSMMPIKVFEYLVSGLPVVSTALSEVKAFSNVVYLAKDDTEFLDLIAKALEDRSLENVMERVALAKNILRIGEWRR